MVAWNLFAASLLALQPVSALWPEPTEYSAGSQTLFIDEDIYVTYNGEFISYTSGYEPTTVNSQQVVQGAVSRSLDVIFQKGLYPWMFHLRNETTSFEPSLSQLTYLSSLAITQTEQDTESTFKPLAGQVDESYELTIETNGEVAITANSSIGVARALETFSQLFYTHSSGDFFYTTFAPVSIKDSPEYEHRGILLDTSRNWYSVAALLRTIDGCAASKLNVLHLHATDAQSWPLQIDALPDLSAKGAYRSDMVYTPADIEQIQTYGAVRGVQVIIEIDQPEHIASVAWSYPELIVAYNYEPYTYMCAEPPCGSLMLNSSAVDDFLDTLMDDLLPRLSPYTAYFHCGGDEIVANNSAIDPSVMSNETDVVAEVLQAYTDKSLARVRKAGLAPLVWEEIPLDWNVTLGNDTVVQAWLGASSVESLTSLGYKVIDSNYDYLYLDCGRGQWVTFQPGESYTSDTPYNDWCSPTKSWELIYSYQPAGNLTSEQLENLIGSEVAIWGETIDEVTLDTLAWPRSSVMGEILWTGPLSTEGSSGTRDQTTAAPRINEFRERLVARGINAASLQMPFCTQGGNCTQPN